MEKELTPFTVELADVAKELKANVIIEFHTMKATFSQEVLDGLRAGGLPTDVNTCITFALLQAGKTEEEVTSYFQEAAKAKHGLRINFEAPDGSPLAVTSKEDNPLLDVFVRAAEGEFD